MNRRRFCKISALALGAFGVGVPDAYGAVIGSGIGRCPSRAFRVTVIRKECYEDIQSLYLDDPEVGHCNVFDLGCVMEFAEKDECPAEFCRRAWDVVVGCVNSSRACADMREDVVLVSCPDGTRPVVFKVELL